MSRETKLGVAYGMAGCVLWGSTFVCLRYLTEVRGHHWLTVASARFVFAAVVLFALLSYTQGLRKSLSEVGRHWKKALFLGATGMFIMGSCVTISTEYTSATMTSLLTNTSPIVIAPLASLVGERLTWKRMLGCIIGLVGAALVILWARGETTPLSGSAPVLGGVIAFLGGVSYSFYTVWGKPAIRELGALWTTMIGMVGGAVMFVGFLIWKPPVDFTAADWVVLIYLVLFPTAIAFALWFKALSYLDAGAVGSMGYLIPVSTLLISWPLLGEEPSAVFLLGTAIIFVGVYLASIGDGYRAPVRAGPPGRA